MFDYWQISVISQQTVYRPTLVAAVLSIGLTDVTFLGHIFHFLLGDLMEEQCSNWVAGGIKIACNAQWAEEGQMLHKWLLESEITQVIFPQFTFFL